METKTTETRREREKRELKKTILDTAREIAKQEGWEAVTIRKIASTIEYGAPAIYALFENKDAILNEIVRESFQQLLKYMQQADDPKADSEIRLRAIGHAYWAFADHYPKIYQAMHGLGGVPFCSGYKPEEIWQIHDLLADIVRAVSPGKELPQSDIDDRVQVMRATLHGLVSITMNGRITGGRERAEALMERAIQDFLKAWRAD
jgi:AcrR family transcriptional regulator